VPLLPTDTVSPSPASSRAAPRRCAAIGDRQVFPEQTNSTRNFSLLLTLAPMTTTNPTVIVRLPIRRIHDERSP